MDSVMEFLPHHAAVFMFGVSAIAGLVYDGKLGWLPPKEDLIVEEVYDVPIELIYSPSPVSPVAPSLSTMTTACREDSPCSPYPACVRNLVRDSTFHLFLLILLLILLGFLVFWLLKDSRSLPSAVSGPDNDDDESPTPAPDRLVKSLEKNVKNLHKKLQNAEERSTAAQRQYRNDREIAAIATHLTTSELARRLAEASRNASQAQALNVATNRKPQKHRSESSGTISRLRSQLRDANSDLERQQETAKVQRAEDATEIDRLTRNVSEERRKRVEISKETSQYKSEAKRLQERVVDLEGQIQRLSRRDVRDSGVQTEVHVSDMGSQTEASPASVDVGAQKEVDVVHVGSQTDVAPAPVNAESQTIPQVVDAESQTDPQVADAESQTIPQVTDADSQTEVNVGDMGSQTDVAPAPVDAESQTVPQVTDANSQTDAMPIPVQSGPQTIPEATSSGSQTNAVSEAVGAEPQCGAPASPSIESRPALSQNPSIAPEQTDNTAATPSAEPTPEELERQELRTRIEDLNRQISSRVRTWVPDDLLEDEVARLEHLMEAQDIRTRLARIEQERAELQATIQERENSLALNRATREAQQAEGLNGDVADAANGLPQATATQDASSSEQPPAGTVIDPTGNEAIGCLPDRTPFFVTVIPRLDDGRRKIYTSAPKVDLRKWARNQGRDLWEFILQRGYYLGDFDANFTDPEAWLGPGRRPGNVQLGSPGAGARPSSLGPRSGRPFDVNAPSFAPATVLRPLPQSAEQGNGEVALPPGSRIPPLDLALFPQWSPRNIGVEFFSPPFLRREFEPRRRHSDPQGGDECRLLFVTEREEVSSSSEEGSNEGSEAVAAGAAPPSPACDRNDGSEGPSASGTSGEASPITSSHNSDASPQPRRRRGGRHPNSRGQSLASKLRKYGSDTILSTNELQRQLSAQDSAIRFADNNGPTARLPTRFPKHASPPRVVLPGLETRRVYVPTEEEEARLRTHWPADLQAMERFDGRGVSTSPVRAPPEPMRSPVRGQEGQTVSSLEGTPEGESALVTRMSSAREGLSSRGQQLLGLFHAPTPPSRESAEPEEPVRGQGLMESRHAPRADDEVAAPVEPVSQAAAQPQTDRTPPRRETVEPEEPVRQQGLMESRHAPNADEEEATAVVPTPQPPVQQQTETTAPQFSAPANQGGMGAGLNASMWAD